MKTTVVIMLNFLLFHRMREPEAVARNVFTRSGGYVFTGRTYYQAQLAANNIQRAGHDFTRAASNRFQSTKSLNARLLIINYVGRFLNILLSHNIKRFLCHSFRNSP